MSSITTAVPSGLIKEWCIQQPIDFDGTTPRECANATRGTVKADFQTFCCNGDIRDTTHNLFEFGVPGGSLDIRDLICCGISGPQQGGLQPINPNAATQCTEGSPTPLAQLAATNTKNAQPYLVTYSSASFGESTTADFVPTVTPTCLWVDTAHGIPMVTTVVAAAHITTLPPPTTDVFGFPIRTDTSYPDVRTKSLFGNDTTAAASTSGTPTMTASRQSPTSQNAGSRRKTAPFTAFAIMLLVFSLL